MVELEVSHLIISKSGLVFNSQNGDSYQINESATLFIELLQGGKKIEQIADSFVENFSISKKQALLDLIEFENQLSVMGLINMPQ